MPSCSEVEGSGGKLRVLFFEDDRNDIELSLRALRAAGFDVSADIATTLDAFCTSIHSGVYDVILSDYRMPGITGMDVFEFTKQEGITIPFILVTGSLGDERAVECLKEGVADYVLKDRLVRLPVAIRRALAEQRLRREREEAHEALRRSEASYRSLIQSAPCGILRLDAADGRLLEVNPALAAILGYESVADLLADDAAARTALGPEVALRLLKTCGRNGSVNDAEIVWTSKAGAPLTVRLSGRVLRNTEGVPVCFEMTAENITERRNAEERIRHLNRLYAVLSHAGQAMVRYRERAPLFREICRILVETGCFQTAWVAAVDPETGVLQRAADCSAFAGYAEDAGMARTHDTVAGDPVEEAIRTAARVICNEVTGAPCAASVSPGCRSCAGFPIFIYGNPVGAIAIEAALPDFFDRENTALLDELAADVSFALESMEAEKLRHRAMDELDQFFSLSLDLLSISDMNGYMLRINPAWEKALGYNAGEMRSRPWVEFVEPADRECALAALAALRRGVPLSGIELRFRGKDGRAIWLMSAASPALDRGVIFTAATDITQRKHLEDRLRRQNLELEDQNHRVEAASRMKSEFLANMSHELRSPLNGIIGFTEVLYDGRVGALETRPKELLGRVHRSAKHLLQLINGILDLSKVEAGRLELRSERISLPNVVYEVVGNLGAQAAEKRISVAVAVGREVHTVVTDAGRLKQILYNYLSNALKFTPDGGRVVIRARAENSMEFRLEVEDSGMGIAEADLPRLFSEFQQLDSTSGKRFQGTGLGLALTKRIVEAQRGRVGVHSIPGEGSTFFAVLPRDARGSPRPAILVIEDDTIQSYLLTRILEDAGYATETARNCLEAVSKCSTRQFAGITLDIVLPDGSGLQLLARIRATEQQRKTPVIIISSLDEEVAQAAEAQGFVPKPVDGRELLAALQRCGLRSGTTESDQGVRESLEAGVLNT